jgi:hypothetical protein
MVLCVAKRRPIEMETYEEIVMQAVSQLMVKAMSGQRVSDEKESTATDNWSRSAKR